MSSMRTLINNIDTFLKQAITDGNINVGTAYNIPITTEDVYVGLSSVPENLGRRPWIALDDGGERVEEIEIDSSHNRFYTVVVEMGLYVHDKETALGEVLDFSNTVKAEFETLANRQLDGHVWGVNIVPFEFEQSSQQFYRIRQVSIEFLEVELQSFDSY
jgi:hypothetical protein